MNERLGAPRIAIFDGDLPAVPSADRVAVLGAHINAGRAAAHNIQEFLSNAPYFDDIPGDYLSALQSRATLGKEAQHELVMGNMRIVKRWAWRIANDRDEAEDLAQSGMLALLKSAGTYDYTKGASFLTFAKGLLLGDIWEAKRTLHTQLSMHKAIAHKARRGKNFADTEEAKTGVRPSMEAQALHVGYDPRYPWYQRAATARSTTVESLNLPIGEGKLGERLELIPSGDEPIEQQVVARQISPAIQVALNRLSEDHRQLVLLKFYKGLSYIQIARKYGAVTEEAVRQRTITALNHVKNYLIASGVTADATFDFS